MRFPVPTLLAGNQVIQRRFLQPKLTISQPGDVFEQQADRITDQVMRMPESGVNLSSGCVRRCSCGQSAISGGLCTACEAKGTNVMRASSDNSAPQIVHDVLRSPGTPLDDGTRTFMESRFRQDFSGVRVHSDSRAAVSALAVNALAYTIGRDVVFAAQQYQPGTDAGRRLLAHELTHVVQQNAGGQPQVQRTCDPTPLSRPDFLKATGFAAKDAPFGLTTLAFKDVKFPAVVAKEVPSKKKGAKPVWTLSQTTTALPDPIPSFYTVGIFEEETATAMIVPDGPCAGKFNTATFWVTGAMGNLLRDGEAEHCADYQYAFDMSLVKFAAAVNALAGKEHCADSKDKCEDSFKRKLEKTTGVAPDTWPDVFGCLANKSEVVRDKRKQLHKPSTRTELSKDCKVRIVMTGLPGLGTPPSDIIKCPELGFAIPTTKSPAPAKTPVKLNPE
jgi:uncharacterized protein DUF4157